MWHTFAGLLLQNGESLACVKDQLGHSTVRMTVDDYGHLIPGANRQAVNKLPVAVGSQNLHPRRTEGILPCREGQSALA